MMFLLTLGESPNLTILSTIFFLGSNNFPGPLPETWRNKHPINHLHAGQFCMLFLLSSEVFFSILAFIKNYSGMPLQSQHLRFKFGQTFCQAGSGSRWFAKDISSYQVFTACSTVFYAIINDQMLYTSTGSLGCCLF